MTNRASRTMGAGPRMRFGPSGGNRQSRQARSGMRSFVGQREVEKKSNGTWLASKDRVGRRIVAAASRRFYRRLAITGMAQSAVPKAAVNREEGRRFQAPQNLGNPVI